MGRIDEGVRAPRRTIIVSANVQRTPNTYQLHGGDLDVRYLTTSLDGKPQFAYSDGQRVLSFEGDAIRTLQSELGLLVSVTILQTVDTGSTSFTLLVPAVDLGESNQAPVRTEGITTTHHFFINPALNRGQTERYKVVRLTGTASELTF
jgi:hypothetical protein